jgi:hypothetical protein
LQRRYSEDAALQEWLKTNRQLVQYTPELQQSPIMLFQQSTRVPGVRLLTIFHM